MKIIEGDSLTIMRGMEDHSFDAVITDPPYGVDYQSAKRIDKDTRFPKIANDGQPFVWWLHDAYRLTKPNGALLCFCRWDVQEAFRLAIGWAGYTLKSQVIWDRGNHGLGDLDGQFAPQHDVIWFATKGDFKFPGRRPMSIIPSMRLTGEQLRHPNEKPVALMRHLVRSVVPAGGSVLDPFFGSGSTGEACQIEGMDCTGIEIDPHYCQVATKRLDSPQLAFRF